MRKIWSDDAWNQYLYWESQDKKTLKRINELIKDIERNGLLNGIGKPEKLKYRPGYSRRIDEVNRLVYDIDANGCLDIFSCKDHYPD
jgi:toxin YoeB